MRILMMSLALGALALGGFAISTEAEARPQGWRCNFAQTAYTLRHRRDIRLTYACYGRSLRETRARARRACRRLSNCLTGACQPLNYRTRHYCSREP